MMWENWFSTGIGHIQISGIEGIDNLAIIPDALDLLVRGLL